MERDLETLYVALILGADHLQDLADQARPHELHDITEARTLILQAAANLAKHIDTSNLSVLR